MGYRIIGKSEWKCLKPTLLGGTDGSLYLSPNEDKILKLLYNFALYHGIEGKKVLLNYLINEKSLKTLAAIPEELVLVPHKNRIGFWMPYLKNGIQLDEWTKQNSGNPEKVLKVYQRISKILKELHEQYGIIVSDCYYTNILILNDEVPIFVDVDSWSMDGIISYTTSNILAAFSKKQFWKDFLEKVFGLCRKKRRYRTNYKGDRKTNQCSRNF